MSISPPHGPIHEETEFWYDPNEKALLYEVNVEQTIGEAFPDHKRAAERGHSVYDPPCEHRPVHRQPHGISFQEGIFRDGCREANVANAELVVRLWYQIENNEQPVKTEFRQPLIPVPKALALFLLAKCTDMYREETLTQAIALLQTYIATKGACQLS